MRTGKYLYEIANRLDAALFGFCCSRFYNELLSHSTDAPSHLLFTAGRHLLLTAGELPRGGCSCRRLVGCRNSPRRCRDSSTLMPGAVFHVRADHAAARAHYVLRVLPGEVDHR